MFGRKDKKDAEPIRQARMTIDEQGYAFRRSRTLTGSASSQVSAVGESRAQIKSPRIKAHELRHRRRWLTLGLASVVAVAGLCVWLLDQYVYTLDVVTSSTPLAKTTDINRLRGAANVYFDSRPFERFRFALNQERFETAMRSVLPEVASVSLGGGKGLIATDAHITFRQPIAMWQSDAQRVYVDKDGSTFTVNYFNEPSVTIEDQSGVAVDGKTQLVASSRLLTFAGRLVSGIDASGAGTVQKVVIPLGALRQLDISLAGTPYRIKTHMDREPVGQVADVVAAVKYFTEKNITPEYIDVRVEGKAYYR